MVRCFQPFPQADYRVILEMLLRDCHQQLRVAIMNAPAAAHQSKHSFTVVAV